MNDTQHSNITMLCYNAECRILFTIILSVVMLSAVMLSVVMLSVAMLSIVMPNVVLLSVVASSQHFIFLLTYERAQ